MNQTTTQETIDKLDDIITELAFISTAVVYMDVDNFSLTKKDMNGLSLMIDKVQKEVEETKEALKRS